MVSIFTDHPFNLVRIKKTVVFITSSHPFKIKQNHTRVETLEQRSIFFLQKCVLSPVYLRGPWISKS